MKAMRQFNLLIATLLSLLVCAAVCADTTKNVQAIEHAMNMQEEEKNNKEEDDDDDNENAALKKEVKRLKLENSKLELENSIRTAKHERSLQDPIEQRKKLEADLELNLIRLQKQLEDLNAKHEALKLRNELRDAQETQDTAPMRDELSRLELEHSLNEQRQTMEMAKIDEEQYRLSRKNALLSEQQEAETIRLSLKSAKMAFELLKIKFDKSKRDNEIGLLQHKIDLQNLQESLKEIAEPSQDYLLDPVVDGYLIVSDRKIDLAGPILWGTAEYISERIDFFNNQNEEYPIFLVITESPGGSVMEGMKILKAMRASRAPVYVVVKALAASMAATITTLADKSFALPDAVMVHHQVSGITGGTVTQLEEQLKVAKEWSRRLLTPVAKKMDLSLDGFIEAMYKNNSTGDWQTFADNAMQLKWVDQIVEGIRDTSYLQRPDKNEQQPWIIFAQAEKVDAQGQRYVQLPRLMPFDVYHIYNPDNYYR